MKPDYILFTDGSSITEKNKVMQYAASSFLVINNHMKTCAKDAHPIGSGDSARQCSYRLQHEANGRNSADNPLCSGIFRNSAQAKPFRATQELTIDLHLSFPPY